MGVIFISILLGGFTQDNVGALLAGDDVSPAAMDANGFRACASALVIQNPYEGYALIVKPSVGIRLGLFTVSLGYLLSPGMLGYIPVVNGVPVTIDASLSWNPLEKLSIRPHLSLIGPSTFFPADPYYTYMLYITGGAGADAVYDPFKGSVIRPLCSLGANAGYAFGTFMSKIDGYEEPLNGFGFSANAQVAGVFSLESFSASLAARVNYGGKFIPDISLSFLW